MIRLVLFDIDGTLIRTGGAGVKAFERTFTLEFGISQATRNMDFAGRTDPSLVRQCFGLHNIPPTPANFRRFFEVYVFLLDHLLNQAQGSVCKGVFEFVQALKALSQPPTLGLLTGNIRLGAELKLRHYQLWSAFQMGAFGDDDENRNHLAAIAQERGRELAGRPVKGEEILVVGDTPLDVECARAIGARMLAVATGGYTCQELGTCAPTWVVQDLAGLDAQQVCLDGIGRTPGLIL